MVQPDGCNFIVVGSSHAGYTAAALRRTGQVVAEVNIPGWRPTSAKLATLKSLLLEAMEGEQDRSKICVCVQLFDNCYFFARGEDGSTLPARRGHDGRYHVDGDSVLAAKDVQFQIFKQLIPVLEAVAGTRLILLAPIPRYLHDSCCEDDEHVPNLREANYKEELEAAVYGCKNNLRDFEFRSGLRGVRVLSTWQLIKKMPDLWADPVHLTEAGYNTIAAELVKVSSELALKRTASDIGGQTRKRARLGGRAVIAGGGGPAGDSREGNLYTPVDRSRSTGGRGSPGWRMHNWGRGHHGGRGGDPHSRGHVRGHGFGRAREEGHWGRRLMSE